MIVKAEKDAKISKCSIWTEQTELTYIAIYFFVYYNK